MRGVELFSSIALQSAMIETRRKLAIGSSLSDEEDARLVADYVNQHGPLP